MPRNLYVHFPFCRRKCSYCVLYSRVGVSQSERAAYVEQVRDGLDRLECLGCLKTIYFGGGSPALCDLRPLSSILRQSTTIAPAIKYIDSLQAVDAASCHPMVRQDAAPTESPHVFSCRINNNQQLTTEFTVELHPLDVTEDKLLELRDLGVNRISMGVQSLDDRILEHMGRNYDSTTAARAFALVKKHFDNAGIDLIVGYPDESFETFEKFEMLKSWGLRHCSVYALQNERRLANVPDDETTMDRIRDVGTFLKSIGLERYEISNYAVPGFECQHNLAVWRGEDYVGLGDGASGRIGLTRTLNFGGHNPRIETLTPERDEIERMIFRLRTREGLDASRHPKWLPTLTRFVNEGLLQTSNLKPQTYFLTPRGAEVCDTILAELV